MTNAERRRELEYLSELYCPGDRDLILSRVPLEHEDESGELYSKYFTFLQTIYSLRSRTNNSTYDMMMLKQKLLEIAQEFRYPVTQIHVAGDTDQ
jgi:hypothetical protein